MSRIRRKIAGIVLRPRIERIIARDCSTRFFGADIHVKSGVFHPTLFFSTVTLWKYIRRQPIRGLSLLEIGTGSGALAVSAARQGAFVTASDINPDAVETARRNAAQNHADITVYHSDLFENIPAQQFDRILINPPFYPRSPRNMKEHAWFCGPEFEFFDRFFRDCHRYLAANGAIWMVLSEDCRISVMMQKASEHGYVHRKVYTRRTWLEKNFVYRLEISSR